MCDKFHREKKKVSYYESGEKNEKKIRGCYKKREKKNITPENIGEIILSQIPGVSSHTSKVIMNKYGSLLYGLLCELDTNQNV